MIPTTHDEWMLFLADMHDRTSARHALVEAQCARDGHVWRWALLDGERCGSPMGGWWYACGRCKAAGQADELPASGEGE